MKKLKNRVINPYVFTGFFICLLFVSGSFKVGILKESGANLKGSGAKKQANIQVQSRVSNVTVVNSTVKNEWVYMTLRNDSQKTITAIIVGANGATISTEYLNTPEVIPSGETFVTDFDLPDKTTKVVYLLAAAFDDGTGEGVPKYVKKIQDTRAGKQAQLERILPIFQDSLAAQSSIPEEQWQKNVLKLQNLPESEEGKSFDYNAALKDAKNLALMQAGEYEQVKEKDGTDKARQRLTHLKETYEGKNRAWSSAVHKQRLIEAK
jgi:hypothetical protein